MSTWWNLQESTEPQPLSVHEENVKSYLKAYFPEMPILEAGLFARVRKFLAFISQQLEASSIQSHNDLKQLILTQSFPNERWWNAKLREFQMGDELVVANGQLGYVSVNSTLRIIKNVSVRTDHSTNYIDLIIKYGKQDFTTVSVDEETAIIKYINQIKMAGVRMKIQKASPDNIKLNIRVDNYIGDSSVTAVPLNQGVGIPFGNVLATHFKQLPFDGLFSLSDAEKALQSSFANPYIRILSAEWKPQNAGLYTPFDSVIASDGGYFTVDLANSQVIFR